MRAGDAVVSMYMCAHIYMRWEAFHFSYLYRMRVKLLKTNQVKLFCSLVLFIERSARGPLILFDFNQSSIVCWQGIFRSMLILLIASSSFRERTIKIFAVTAFSFHPPNQQIHFCVDPYLVLGNFIFN